MRNLILLLLLFITICSQGQDISCGIDENLGYDDLLKSEYVPSGNIKYIRVAVHFILKDDGTGNFNEINDGLANPGPFNGYTYANYIINYANQLLANPDPMRLQPFGNLPVYDTEIRFVIVGVFFWRNTTAFNYNNTYTGISYYDNNFGLESSNCINLYLGNSTENNVRGIAKSIGGSGGCMILGHYKKYIEAVNNNNMWYNRMIATMINHEIGHLLDLKHTFSTNCSQGSDDFCDDTPSIEEMLALGQLSPCCWNGNSCSNNVMDYNADQSAWTPFQLDRIHKNIERVKENYLIGNYTNQTANKTSFNQNDLVIANTININASISNASKVYLNANNVLLQSGFIIEPGSILTILTNP